MEMINHTNPINPVTRLDYPDPDVIRVDDTYYMVSTTMHFMPGCEILRSYDLADWEHAAYVYETLDGTPCQRLQDGGNIYGKGMWAASLRYKKNVDGTGRFYICFVANDTHKTYLYTAENIEGPWEKKYIEGFYHDCSLLFDDDGSVYIAYGNTDIYITQLKEDLSGPMEGGLHRLAVSDAGNPYLGCEGTHFYKINGRYYLFCIHSRRDRWRRTQCCFVSDSIRGEFTGRDILDDDRGYCGQGVAQGGIVDTPDGRWYAMLFQDSGAVGRLPVLVPMAWQNGFPVLGVQGHIPEKFELKSTRPGYKYHPLVESDDFRSALKPCWQFNHEPDWSLIHHDRAHGCWRVATGVVCRELTEAVNTITQRMLYPSCAAEATVDGSQIREGDYAGLCALQGSYCMIALTRRGGMLYIAALAKDMQAQEYIPVEGGQARFRLEADFTNMKDTASLYYLAQSNSCARWEKAGPDYKLHFGLDHFTGCRFGLAFYSTMQAGGMADFSDFIYYKGC